MALSPALSGAIHDLQARLGSIHIAVTAVVGLDLDGETRTEMLTSASEESVRASAELAGIGALAACALDASEPSDVDLGSALTDAATAARLAGIDVELNGRSASVAARAPRVAVALPALLRLAAGAGRHLRAATEVSGAAVRLRVERCGDDPDAEPLPPIVDYLADALGATREPGDALVLAFGAEQ